MAAGGILRSHAGRFVSRGRGGPDPGRRPEDYPSRHRRRPRRHRPAFRVLPRDGAADSNGSRGQARGAAVSRPPAAAAAAPAPAADLAPHRMQLALIHAQIPPTTGNIARLCVATGTELHLVRPLGFVLSDRELRRSAMDYWPRLKLTVHDSNEAFFGAMRERRFWFFENTGAKSLWDCMFQDGDVLIFGSET